MAKIIIGKKTNQSGYFEIDYTFILDVPRTQQDAMAKQASAISATVDAPVVDYSTIKQTGVAGYSEGTRLEEIKADLINRFNEAQDKINSESKFEFNGLTYDGREWA